MPKTLAPYKCMHVLGNELRTNIISLLCEKPLTVKQISEKLGKEQSLVSHALKELKECSFVSYEKNGKHNTYSIKTSIFGKNQNKGMLELFENHAKKHCTQKGCY